MSRSSAAISAGQLPAQRSGPLADEAAARVRLVADLLECDERDRRAVAAALHDGPVQDVLAARYATQLALAVDPSLAQALAAVTEALDEALQQSRRIMRRLKAPMVTGEALAEAVAQVLEGSPVTVAVTGTATGSADLTARLGYETTAKILREALDFGARRADVHVERLAGSLQLSCLVDRLPVSENPLIAGLARRLVAVGGELTATTDPDGVRVVARIPELGPSDSEEHTP